MPGADAAAVERAYRESSGRAVATLARVFGDIDIAEDAVQEAFAVAAQRWPAAGVPPCCTPTPRCPRWDRCTMTACG